MFLSAQEPITVEVKRRTPSSSTQDELPGGSPKRMLPVVVGEKAITSTASIGVQTEDDLRPNLLMDEEDDDPVFDESPVSDQIVNIFDECLVPDVDFEVSGGL